MTSAAQSASGLPPAARILAPAPRGPTIWVVAVMTCLAILGIAAAMALTPAAAALSGQIAGRATVQIVEADPLVRRAAVRAVRESLRDAPYVMAVRTVPEAELTAIATRWLGPGVADTGLPLPALIDVDLIAGGGDQAMRRLRDQVESASPAARLIPHADWLGPVANVLRTLGWLAALTALVLVLAAASITMLAARAALSAQRSTIDILHLVGATDVQIARIFQRNTAREVAMGAFGGGVFAALILVVLFWQSRTIGAGLTGLSGAQGSLLAYLWLLVVPVAVTLIAIATARWVVLRTLRGML